MVVLALLNLASLPPAAAAVAFPTESSSNPRRQLTEEDSENPRSLAPADRGLALQLRALKNQSSDLVDAVSTRICSMLDEVLGKRKRRRRPGFAAPPTEELLQRRSYSSTIFSRSSSVVTEIKESRSSLGIWYLREKDWLWRRVLERRWWRSEREVWRSITMIRVSPPM
ncbi:hypothetical protein MIMGU_mgv1a026079mg [Erythranthe guttata]|uniref:Uncharacterized protein n=1 Tax=Erythranthe guttata TaxID=4155 RepID=A0A022RKU1_ERYGU|nr:hypothetical protein MIMGU_mgv1a026079mg [Erythranthe guttata]